MAASSERGHEKLAGWLSQAEVLWNASSAGTMTLRDRWNYQCGLANQFPTAGLRVVFAASGTLPAALVLRDRRAVVEHALYWMAASTEHEALYLAAILNSEATRLRAEHFQARGQFGARHFDKVVFNLPIAQFNASDSIHYDLAQAGAHAEKVACMVELVEGERFQRARRRVRDALAEEGIGAEIEKLVEKLLDG
jgi:hypothetical protein